MYARVYSVIGFKYINALLSLASRSNILRILVCAVYFILSNTKQLTIQVLYPYTKTFLSFCLCKADPNLRFTVLKNQHIHDRRYVP